ncbi:MAG: hypothetical protein JW384_00592 [Nitrosomonadaceae bacterium]|nr:hypothetical protein [Nitrosomonadaceae bacterium]
MSNLLTLVDQGKFTELFLDELGWGAPSLSAFKVSASDAGSFELSQVATYNGMGVWLCQGIPELKVQRQIDSGVAVKNAERLIIYVEGSRQEWRWPRYTRQKSSGRPSLVPHRHTVGQPNSTLVDRLEQITIPLGSTITVPELLQKMRDAFDVEAETASRQAARLMGGLYEQLEVAGMGEQDASVFLARMLFLMFADDTDMWKSNLFYTFLTEHTALDGVDLNAKLEEVFAAADTPEKSRPSDLSPGLVELPYINGGIFAEHIRIPTVGPDFRKSLIEACRFDWGQISPAVFGSMFQTVKSREARRHLGEHYTTEKNILKTIEPLFLDELHTELEASWNDSKKLASLQNKLGEMRFLDPACGCGNFLIVAYRELREIELEILKRQRDIALEAPSNSGPLGQSSKGKRFDVDAQLSIDATLKLKVTIEQFYGIEIEAWPARIAETAMFLVDHQANLRMETELGQAPRRLPIEISPHIYNQDALTSEWKTLFPLGQYSYIFGNPPFLGQYTKSKAQTELTKAVWGHLYNGYLDFVTCWHKKAIDYYGPHAGRWAFVSTNSISQGEPVGPLWRPILNAGWRCRFAHRSFKWTSEAAGQAGVHVSIIGFDKEIAPDPLLFEYPEGGEDLPVSESVHNINPYLVPHSNVIVDPVTSPISQSLPEVTKGSQPTDGGNLLVSPEEYAQVAEDPIAAKYLRPFMGAREMLHGAKRWCLWLVEAKPSDLSQSPVLRFRLDAVREMRSISPKSSTRRQASTPHLFDEIRQLDVPYLAIPSHVSEHREYFTAAYYPADVICGNANFMAPDPDGFLLAVLSSSMFMTWQKTIGGRLKSDIRFSNTYSYNTLPLPKFETATVKRMSEAGQSIVSARANYPGTSLADLYAPQVMPNDLLEAHKAVDSLMLEAFGLQGDASLDLRQDKLFTMYEALVGRDTDSSLFSLQSAQQP